MKYIDGGICAAKGFKASGTYCGIKKPNVENFDPQIKHKNDICLFTSDVLCNAAAVYTQNKVKGAPILVTKANLEKSGNKAIAVIANSKNANTCNADGVEKADKMCELVANELNIPKEQVIVASTGVIGQVLPIEPIEKAVPILVKELDYGKNEEASTAIMTTDTIKKEYAVEFEIDGVKCTLGGMAKGSGMIHPNMATTLNFITSDCAVSSDMLQKALSEIVKVTYNCLSVDGDTSTNDMVSLMANGLAGNEEITCEGEEFDLPYHAVRVDVAQYAVEHAEQEAEERMRKKAIKAFCYFVMEYHCKEAICSKRNKCDASCVIAQYFIQKLTENENDD